MDKISKEQYLEVRSIFKYGPKSSYDSITSNNFLKRFCEEENRNFIMLTKILNGCIVTKQAYREYFKLDINILIDHLDLQYEVVTIYKNKLEIKVY